MVLAHQVVPARLLVGPHGPDTHFSQGDLGRDHSASYRITKACLFSLPPKPFVIQPLLPNIEKPWLGPKLALGHAYQ